LLVNGSLAAGSAVTVMSGAVLGGTGVINGVVTNRGIIAPGKNGPGMLTVSNSLTLAAGSAVQLEVGYYGGARSNDVLHVSGTLAYGGALLVTNTGPDTLVAGDSFQLFQAAGHSGGFASVNLPPLPADLLWNTNNLIISGTVSVVSGPTGTNMVRQVVKLAASATVTASGVSGYSYALERATNLVSPVWVNLSTNVAGTNGVINAMDGFLDLSNGAPGAAFYRFLWVP